jgi:hypothetical protein
MDQIKERLKKRSSLETQIIASQPVIGISQPGLSVDTVLSVSDSLLQKNFLTHIDANKIFHYFSNKSDNKKKTLILAEIYAAKYGTKNLYDILEEPIHINSWVAFLSQIFEYNLNSFLEEITNKQYSKIKKLHEEIAEDALYQYVHLNFNEYRTKVRFRDQNLIVLCDNLLQISPPTTETNDISTLVKKKIDYVKELVESNHIKIKNDDLNTLYLLDGLRELKDYNVL